MTLDPSTMTARQLKRAAQAIHRARAEGCTPDAPLARILACYPPGAPDDGAAAVAAARAAWRCPDCGLDVGACDRPKVVRAYNFNVPAAIGR